MFWKLQCIICSLSSWPHLPLGACLGFSGPGGFASSWPGGSLPAGSGWPRCCILSPMANHQLPWNNRVAILGHYFGNGSQGMEPQHQSWLLGQLMQFLEGRVRLLQGQLWAVGGQELLGLRVPHHLVSTGPVLCDQSGFDQLSPQCLACWRIGHELAGSVLHFLEETCRHHHAKSLLPSDARPRRSSPWPGSSSQVPTA